MTQILENIKNDMQKGEQQLINEVMERFHIAKAAKEGHFKAGFSTNYFDTLLSFYLGKQLGNRPKPTDVVLNNLTTIIQSAISTILQVPLTIELIPDANSDQQQIEQVKKLEKALLFYWLDSERLNMSQKIKDLLLRMKIYGTGFLYPHYLIENNLLNLRMDVIDPEYIYPDPSCMDTADAEFIFYSAPVPLVKIQRWYPERGKFVKEEFTTTISSNNRDFRSNLVEVLHNSMSFVSTVGATETEIQRNRLPSANLIFGFFRDDTQETVNINSYSFVCCGNRQTQQNVSSENIRCPLCNRLIPEKYIIKNTLNTGKKHTFMKYPHGRMIVVSNGILLDDRPNPYYEFPFIKFINIDTTRYWGLGDVEYLMAEQIAINRLLSMGMEIIKKTATRPIIVDEQALREGIKSTAFGDVIEKLPGSNIQWMDMPPLPSGLFELCKLFIVHMDTKTGLYDRGRIKTATEATLLSETEQQRQLTLLTNVEQKLKKIVLHILYILTNYHTYTEQISLDYQEDDLVFRGIDYQRLLFKVRIKFQTDIVQSKMVRHKQALETLQSITNLVASQLLSLEDAVPRARKLFEDLGI